MLSLHPCSSCRHVDEREGCRANPPSRPTPPQKAPCCRDHQVKQCHWQNELPREVHQLILPQTRESTTHPNQHNNRQHDLGEKPDPRGNPVQRSERCRPASQKERRPESRNRQHGEIFTEEEERKLESGIFGEISSDQF